MDASNSLYITLGLPRDASPEAITKAYRKLAKRFHPDRNVGDDDAKANYAAVDQAYRVLSDSARREKYDRTGEFEDLKPDNSITEIMSVLSPLMFGVLKAIVKQGGEVKEEDVVKHLCTALKHGKKELSSQRAGLLKDVVALQESADRFAVDEGEVNLLAAAAHNHIRAVQDKIEELDRELVRVEKVGEYLKKCRYNAAARKVITQMPRGMWSVGTASTTSSW